MNDKRRPIWSLYRPQSKSEKETAFYQQKSSKTAVELIALELNRSIMAKAYNQKLKAARDSLIPLYFISHEQQVKSEIIDGRFSAARTLAVILERRLMKGFKGSRLGDEGWPPLMEFPTLLKRMAEHVSFITKVCNYVQKTEPSSPSNRLQTLSLIHLWFARGDRKAKLYRKTFKEMIEPQTRKDELLQTVAEAYLASLESQDPEFGQATLKAIKSFLNEMNTANKSECAHNLWQFSERMWRLLSYQENNLAILKTEVELVNDFASNTMVSKRLAALTLLYTALLRRRCTGKLPTKKMKRRLREIINNPPRLAKHYAKAAKAIISGLNPPPDTL